MTDPARMNAAEIARKAKSNLAFALACLPARRRQDMVTFYAFCRVVDDIADEDGISVRDRRIQLGAWRRMVRHEQEPADALARAVVALPAHHGFEIGLLEEIIDGVSMDLEFRRYDTFAELEKYCYKVASVVGLVSLRIFGLPPGVGEEYAIKLGLALQLTNILRDVRADWENGGRVYLPQEDLATFGYHEADIAASRYNAAFPKLMAFQSERALEFFAAARRAFPHAHAGRLQSAEAMRRIYEQLLHKMRADGFRVYEKRYRLNNLAKAMILLGSWWRTSHAS